MLFPRVTRRSFLSGLGAGTAAIIARPLVRECFADGTPPRRLLVIYMPNTSIRANWLPTGGRTPLTKQGDARQFTLKACNETLAPVREQMTLVTGMDLKKIQGCNHGSAIVNLMTGSGSNAKGSTFDQIMADRSPLLKGTQVSSLQLGTDMRADAGKNGIQLRVMSYDLKGAPMPPEIEPRKTYTRIFSSLVPASTPRDHLHVRVRQQPGLAGRLHARLRGGAAAPAGPRLQGPGPDPGHQLVLQADRGLHRRARRHEGERRQLAAGQHHGPLLQRGGP